MDNFKIHHIAPDYEEYKKIEESEKLNNDRKFKESLENSVKEKQKKQEKKTTKKPLEDERIIDIKV